jgi:hypothetical protein
MARQKQQFLGIYESMDFEPYVFQEYPKVVGYRDAAKTDPILVNNAKEEVDFITTGSPGAVKSKEEELKAELDRKAVELEQAKEQLEAMKKPEGLKLPEKK